MTSLTRGPAHPCPALGSVRSIHPFSAPLALRGVTGGVGVPFGGIAGRGRDSPQTGPDGRRDYRARLEARAHDTEGALVPRPIASVVMVPEWTLRWQIVMLRLG